MDTIEQVFAKTPIHSAIHSTSNSAVRPGSPDESVAGLMKIANGRDTLPTKEAAFVLNRQMQTLRIWAVKENGPILPIRIQGRLHWPVSRLAELLLGHGSAAA